MPESAAPATTRPGRCAHHPGVAAVGTCERCGRALCVACAVPVRGTIVGPECLASVLEKPPATIPVPSPVSPIGDWLARIGFGVVVALTVLPWSRFGQGSRILGAWAPTWSLLAAMAGLAGLGLAVIVPRRPADPRLVASGYALLAILVALGALLHVYRPPLLSEASAAALGALFGAGLALLGAVMKGRAVVLAGRSNG